MADSWRINFSYFDMPIAGIGNKAAIGHTSFNLFQPHPVEVIEEFLVSVNTQSFKHFFGVHINSP